MDNNFDLDETNCMAYFRIAGDDFDIDYVSRELSLQPTEYWRIGDVIAGRNRKREYTCWIISTGYIVSLDVGEVLEGIVKQLSGKEEVLLSLKEKFDLHYRFEIVVDIENKHAPGLYFAVQFIHFVSQIGADIDVDMYVC